MLIILKGGTSAEREVSLWTAQTIAECLRNRGEAFVEIDAADSDWLDQVVAHNPKAVIIALHGPFGEDGSVQKLLEEKGIAYTGSNSKVSALTINKARTKQIIEELGITTPQSLVLEKGETPEWVGKYPIVVKPNSDGSSFGVTIVQTEAELSVALAEAFKYGTTILIEEYIKGTELTCGVIEWNAELKALPLVEIRPKEEFFNFAAKYSTTKCDEICPAPVPENVTKHIQDLSTQIFKKLGTSQYARVDWILHNETPYFLEINTLPGMTKTSLIIKELAAAGIEYDQFLGNLIKTATVPL